MFARKKLFGFTIIELIVVMAIMMILVGILIPVVAGARSKALDVKCVGHMKSWGHFITRYSTTHSGSPPPVVGADEALYTAGTALKAFFRDEKLDPQIAYCPANSKLFASLDSEGWGKVEVESSTVNFSSPLVLVDNVPASAAAPASIPTVEVDNSAAGADDYFEITGPATPEVKVTPAGYLGANYLSIEGVDAAGGGGTVELIVDNTSLSGPTNWLEFAGTGSHGVSTNQSGYHADDYQYVRAEAPPSGAELVVVDNMDVGGDDYFEYAGSAGSGESVSAPGYHATNYRWMAGVAGATTGTATWHFKVPDPGGMAGQSVNIEVQAWWPTWPEKGMDGIKYTVNYEGGSQEVTVNQLTGGAAWTSLGVFSFKYDSSYTVTLSNSTTEYGLPDPANNKFVFADAVRILSVGDGPLIAKWHFTVADPGGMAGDPADATIDGKWPLAPVSAVKDVRFVIYHDTGSTTKIVDQQTIGADWHNFGDFPILYGSSYRVEMHSGSMTIGDPAETNKWMFADAIRVTTPGGGSDPTTAIWHFKVPDPGGRAGDTVNLKVEARWPGSATECVKDATFTITREGGDSVVTVDQQVASTGDGPWETLGSFNFVVGSSYSVQLSNRSSFLADPAATNTKVHADAIRISDTSGGGGDGLPDSGFGLLTAGWNESSVNPTAYGSGSPKYQWTAQTTSNHKEAVWMFEAPAGLHTVYGWWPKNTTHATGVPFTIHRRSTAEQIASASMSQQDGGEWIPIATCDFVEGEDYYVKVSSNAVGTGAVMADAIAIPDTDTGAGGMLDVFGYLYLGDRINLPEPPEGMEPPSPVQLVKNIKAIANPSGTPILVDWMSDSPGYSNHNGYAHILMLDLSVQRISFGDATHRWTSAQGLRFFW